MVDVWSPHLPTYVDPHLSILSTENPSHGDEDDEEETDQYLGGNTGAPLSHSALSVIPVYKQLLGSSFG